MSRIWRRKRRLILVSSSIGFFSIYIILKLKLYRKYRKLILVQLKCKWNYNFTTIKAKIDNYIIINTGAFKNTHLRDIYVRSYDTRCLRVSLFFTIYCFYQVFSCCICYFFLKNELNDSWSTQEFASHSWITTCIDKFLQPFSQGISQWRSHSMFLRYSIVQTK